MPNGEIGCTRLHGVAWGCMGLHPVARDRGRMPPKCPQMLRGGFVFPNAFLRGHSGALGGIWVHSDSCKERGRNERKGRNERVFFALFAIFVNFVIFASHFPLGAEVAPSISSGALRFCDDECAARRDGFAFCLGKQRKFVFKLRILWPRGAALLSSQLRSARVALVARRTTPGRG